MKNFSIILSTVAIILATVAIVKVFDVKTPVATPAVTAGSVSQADITDILVNKNPKIVFDALQAYDRQRAEEEEKAAAELMEKYAGEIGNDEGVPSVGPKDAKVIVTEFFDFSCGHCKRLSPEIEKLIADNADVKFVFKPLTFVSPNSAYQAKAAFAAFNQGKFLEFYKGVMEGNSGTKELVDAIAQGTGVDMDKYKADVESAEIDKNLSAVSEFAQKIRVYGVPAVFVNGKQTQSRSAGELQQVINAAK